jgi:hypothetical protein
LKPEIVSENSSKYQVLILKHSFMHLSKVAGLTVLSNYMLVAYKNVFHSLFYYLQIQVKENILLSHFYEIMHTYTHSIPIPIPIFILKGHHKLDTYIYHIISSLLIILYNLWQQTVLVCWKCKLHYYGYENDVHVLV